LKKIETYVNEVKAEAAYFFEADGNRVAAFIVIYRVQTDTNRG